MDQTSARKHRWGAEHEYRFKMPSGTERTMRIAYDTERGCLNISAIDGLQPRDVEAFFNAVRLAIQAASE